MSVAPIPPTPASSFQQLPRPKHPTPCEVETYRSAANYVGRAETMEHLREGRIASAFHRIVRTTEAEARITNGLAVHIPTANRAWALVQQRHARRGWV